MNRALFSSHCYLSWGFVAPYFIAVIHVAAALRFHLKAHSVEDKTITSGGELIDTSENGWIDPYVHMDVTDRACFHWTLDLRSTKCLLLTVKEVEQLNEGFCLVHYNGS